MRGAAKEHAGGFGATPGRAQNGQALWPPCNAQPKLCSGNAPCQPCFGADSALSRPGMPGKSGAKQPGEAHYPRAIEQLGKLFQVAFLRCGDCRKLGDHESEAPWALPSAAKSKDGRQGARQPEAHYPRATEQLGELFQVAFLRCGDCRKLGGHEPEAPWALPSAAKSKDGRRCTRQPGARSCPSGGVNTAPQQNKKLQPMPAFGASRGRAKLARME